MAPPPIAKSFRYRAKGKSKCYWVPTLAIPSAPSRLELDAGLDLTPQVMSTEGWQVQSESIETPDLDSDFTGSIPAGTSVDDSSLTLYSDLNGDDVRKVLHRDDSGFIVWLHGGDVPGNRTMDVHPVRVGSVGKAVTLDDEASSIEIAFNITAEPQENLEIPA